MTINKKKYMKIQSIILAVLLSTSTFAFAQDTPQPRRQGPPPTVQCEGMKNLMKAMQDHRKTCEVCKTNPPPRGMFGPRMGGKQGQGQGRGQGRGPQGPPS